MSKTTPKLPQAPAADLLADIRVLLTQARRKVAQAVNSAMVQTYWHIGRIIVEHEQSGNARAEYGKQQLTDLSTSLGKEFGKGFDVTNLRNMRRFYQVFPIRETLSLELAWSHFCKIIRLDSPAARDWYIAETIANRWTVRALERQISTLYYERLLSSRDKAPVIAEAQQNIAALENAAGSADEVLNAKDFLRDPYVLDFLNLPDASIASVLESTLEQRLMDNLQKFLLELGTGFAFVARQQRIRTEDQDFYIDLVFYHFKLKCFVLIDLKIGKLSHQDVGQMDSYIRIYDQTRKDVQDRPTLGLILCSEKSEAVVKYSILTDSAQLFASQYKPYLPTEDELRRELERDRAQIDARQQAMSSHARPD
jgi:predicted nuclease of restriction endonuclease-like (RecB) superfamily